MYTLNGVRDSTVYTVVVASPLKVTEFSSPAPVIRTLNEAMGLNPVNSGLLQEMTRVVVVLPVTSRLVGGPGGTGRYVEKRHL